MFVRQSRLRRNPKTTFFNNKESLAMGDKSERLVYPFLERDCNPTAVTPHTNIFYMQSENSFVAGNVVCVKVTPAQNKLLQLLKGPHSVDYAESLKIVHTNGTYFTEDAVFSAHDSHFVHILLDALQELSTEHLQNTSNLQKS